MDTTAHRIVKHARDTLVDGLGLGLNDLLILGRPAERRHGVSDDQAIELDRIVWALWDVMNNDPSPPECQHCATGLTQPKTGRPRRYCSDACRSADHRAKSS